MLEVSPTPPSPHTSVSPGHLTLTNLFLLLDPDVQEVYRLHDLLQIAREVEPGINRPRLLALCRELIPLTGIDIIDNTLDFFGDVEIHHSEKSLSLYPEYRTSNLFPRRWLEVIEFPGHGRKKSDRCGEVVYWKTCSANPSHFARPARHTCNRQECPECWPNWMRQAVDRAVSRVEGYQDALTNWQLAHRRRRRVYRPRHFSFHPDDRNCARMAQEAEKAVRAAGLEDQMIVELPKAFLNILFREAYGALRISGLDGAVVIPHMYRIADEYKDMAKRLAREKNEDRQVWEPKWNRYTVLMNDPAWREKGYFEYSPHVHILCYGHALEPEEFIDECPGWNYRNHQRVDENTGKTLGNEPRPVLSYLLTHAPVIKGKQLIRYWGCLSPRRLNCIRKTEETEYQYCPVCGEVVVQAALKDEGKQLFELDKDHPVQLVRTIREYQLMGGPPGRKKS